MQRLLVSLQFQILHRFAIFLVWMVGAPGLSDFGVVPLCRSGYQIYNVETFGAHKFKCCYEVDKSIGVASNSGIAQNDSITQRLTS